MNAAPNEKKHAPPGWLRLDNAANIYPPARSRNWSALFRVSAHMTGDIDPEILRQASLRATSRFPAFSVQMKKGVFWYYLERQEGAPPVLLDSCCPCEPLRPEHNDGFAFRVRYHGNRMAVEFFHALTDGTGALSFTKTLMAEYITLKYGEKIPRDDTILDCDQPARPAEYEDSFRKYAGRVSRMPREKNAFRIKGELEKDGFVNLTCGLIPVDEVLKRAREKGASLTQYLMAVLILAIDAVQRHEVWHDFNKKPVKLCVPVNLRAFFESKTTRNFANIISVGIDPKMGHYSLEEVIGIVRHQMGLKITARNMQAQFTSYVNSEKHPILRAVPLFIKSPALKLAFQISGDRKTSTTFTNLGNVTLPAQMQRHVTRMELIIGPLSANPIGFSLLSYNGTLYINITRRITSPKVEQEFFTRLVKLGIPVKLESNQRENEGPLEGDEKRCPIV